jgi:hypothetical protein
MFIGVKTVAANWCFGPRQPLLPKVTLHDFPHQTLHVPVSVRTCTVTYQACLRHGAVLSDEAEYNGEFTVGTLSFRLHLITTLSDF